MAPRTSEAGTAANATLRNTVTVDYKNASGTQMAPKTAFVDITVSLKAATPTLTLVSGAAQNTPPNTGIDYTYTLTTNANGPDTYNLSTSVTDMATQTTASTVEFRTAAVGGGSVITALAPVTLGATTAAAGVAIPATTQTTVTVLRDNGTYGATVNNIAVNDTVVFGSDATVCTVNSVTAASGLGTTTIDVTCTAAVAVNLGDQIREFQTVYLHVVPGTTTAITNQTITVDTTARDAGLVEAATAVSQTVTTVLVPQLTVDKYVRNVSGGADETAGNSGGMALGKITIDTLGGAGLVDYFLSGVKGKPGNTLEYVIAINTSNGGGNAQDVKISDPLTSYTTYVAGSMRLDPGNGTFGALLDGANDADAGEYKPTAGSETVYIYAGTGGTDGAAPLTYGDGTGGTLAPNKTTYGVYRVTIN